MEHMIESGIVHGLIYRLVWMLSHHMGIGGFFAFALAGIAAVALTRRVLRRRRRAG